jgi:hypothetical protein
MNQIHAKDWAEDDGYGYSGMCSHCYDDGGDADGLNAARAREASERNGVFVDSTGDGTRAAPKRSLNDSTPP